LLFQDSQFVLSMYHFRLQTSLLFRQEMMLNNLHFYRHHHLVLDRPS